MGKTKNFQTEKKAVHWSVMTVISLLVVLVALFLGGFRFGSNDDTLLRSICFSRVIATHNATKQGIIVGAKSETT